MAANGKLREIERLRALAALMVVFTHTGPGLGVLGGIFGHPRTGVDLFFVISGFVVTRSLLRLLPDLTGAADLGAAFDRCRGALRMFYTRRFFRIVPLAVAVVVLQRAILRLPLPASTLGGDVNGYWREVAAIFTGVYNYAMPEEGYNQFGVYWSLSVEEHFYLLLPLTFLLARSRGKRIGVALGGIAFVALVCRNFFDVAPAGTSHPDFYRVFASHLRFDALLAGVALALLFEGAPSKAFMPPRFIRWFVLPASLALVWAIPRALPGNTYYHQGFTAAWFLCGVLVAYASFDRGYVFEIPVLARVLEHLGARSYALYLLHVPLMRVDEAIKKVYPTYADFCAARPWTHWGLFVVAVVAAAEVSWWVLEWPLQKVGRRLTTSTPPVEARVGEPAAEGAGAT